MNQTEVKMTVFSKRKNAVVRLTIVLCSFIILGTSIGVSYNCWGLFTVPVCGDIEISRKAFGTLYSAIFVGQIIASLLFGRMLRRIKLIKIVRISATVLPVIMLLFSQIKRAEQLWLLGLLLGIFQAGVSFLPFSMIAANWFVKFRGVVTGVIFMSSGLIGALLSPIVNGCIGMFGWRRSIVYLACILALIDIPISWIFLFEHPRDKGMTPLGSEEKEIQASRDDAWGFDSKECIHQPRFWLFIVYTVGLFMSTALGGTIAPYLQDIGYSSTFSALLQSAGMLSIAGTRVLCGQLCDKTKDGRAVEIMSVISGVFFIGLLGAGKGMWFVLLIPVGQGLVQATSAVCYPLTVGTFFGRKHYAEVSGMLNAFSYAICAVTPLIYGNAYSEDSSYRYGYLIILFAYGIGIVCLLLSRNADIREKQIWK